MFRRTTQRRGLRCRAPLRRVAPELRARVLRIHCDSGGGGSDLRSALRADPRSVAGRPSWVWPKHHWPARCKPAHGPLRVPAGSPPADNKKGPGAIAPGPTVEAAGVEPASAIESSKATTCVDRCWLRMGRGQRSTSFPTIHPVHWAYAGWRSVRCSLTYRRPN